MTIDKNKIRADVLGKIDYRSNSHHVIDATIKACAAHYEAELLKRDALIAEKDKALAKIDNWVDFPATGRTWKESGQPMSFGAAFGSNGERDYMRKIAADALSLTHDGAGIGPLRPLQPA